MDSRCPRKLKDTPCSACPMGKQAVDAARDGKEAGCPWFVNDAESHFCFFKFMNDNGPRSVSTPKIAQKLMLDEGEIKKIEKGFRKKAAEVLDPTSSKK